jgi:hypothetical protein
MQVQVVVASGPYLASSNEEEHDCRDNEEDLQVLDGVATIVDDKPDCQANNKTSQAGQWDGLEAALGTNTCGLQGK